jgi:hypothetical protein
MKKTLSMMALTSILSIIAAAQGGAVDVGCQFATADDIRPCSYSQGIYTVADDDRDGARRYQNRKRGKDDNEQRSNADATCSAPGTDQYSVLRHDNGAGVTWQMTNDTRNCPQAGIDDPVFKADGGSGD